MKIISPSTKAPLPDRFTCVCEKGGNGKFNKGCGATLEVTTEDCFTCKIPNGDIELGFFCEACGILITPYWDWSDPRNYAVITDDMRAIATFQVEGCMPPWNPRHGFLSLEKYCEKNNIQWGLR